MVTIEYIFREELDELVRLSYEGDTELFKRFHMEQNMTFEEAVNSSLYLFNETAKEVDLTHYKVMLGGEPIGYFTTFPKCLYSFAIGMKWRSKEVLSEVWEKIKSVFEDRFACVLYKNNTRAIGWLNKCGMTCVENDFNDNSISLIY